jgi:uncharacterized protein
MVRAIFLCISGRCNLACSYCFAAQGAYGEAPNMMDWPVAQRAIDSLIRWMGRARSGQILFFGGEPLLNWPVLKRATDYARTQAANRGKQIAYSVTTNGTFLTRAKVDFLRANKFRIMISIDSHVQETNDRLRPGPGRGSSFERVLRGLALFDPSDEVSVRATITPENTDLKSFLRYFSRYKCIKTFAFSPVHHDSPCQKSCDIDSYRKAAAGYMEFVFERWDKGDFIYPHHFMGSIYLYRKLKKLRKPLKCCSAASDTISVSSTGRLYLCPLLNDIGDFHVGDLMTGLDTQALKGLLRRIDVSEKERCRDCSVRVACGGGCHQLNYIYSGKLNVPSPDNCEYTRFNLECARRIAEKADGWLDHYRRLSGSETHK